MHVYIYIFFISHSNLLLLTSGFKMQAVSHAICIPQRYMAEMREPFPSLKLQLTPPKTYLPTTLVRVLFRVIKRSYSRQRPFPFLPLHLCFLYLAPQLCFRQDQICVTSSEPDIRFLLCDFKRKQVFKIKNKQRYYILILT